MARETETNTQLVQKCLRGNAQAWEQLVARYAGLVHSVPIRHGLTPMEVDDVGQDVFLMLAQNLQQVEDPERLGGWLVTTARRLSWRVLQQRQREEVKDLADFADLSDRSGIAQNNPLISQRPSIDDLLNGWGRQEILTRAMQQMSVHCRELLMLLFLDPEEPTYNEISKRLQIPKGSIGPTRNRCLSQMRDKIGDLL